MIVKCGACRTQFDVPGEGRYSCPVCGSVNVVRGRDGAPAPGPGGVPGAPGIVTPPPPPPPDVPSPRIECPECSFTFIVGNIAVASCPNCGAEVPTGRDVPEPEEA